MKTTTHRTILSGLISLLLIAGSCSSNKDSLTPAQASVVKDSVQKMAESIAAAVSHEGPMAWIRYFENSPGFFMASEGQLVFPNNAMANDFIKNKLVKIMPKIELHWSNIRIEPLTRDLASLAATFHEDISYADGRKLPSDGYFTAVARQTSQGWKLHNAHWSTKCEATK